MHSVQRLKRFYNIKKNPLLYPTLFTSKSSSVLSPKRRAPTYTLRYHIIIPVDVFPLQQHSTTIGSTTGHTQLAIPACILASRLKVGRERGCVTPAKHSRSPWPSISFVPPIFIYRFLSFQWLQLHGLKKTKKKTIAEYTAIRSGQGSFFSH